MPFSSCVYLIGQVDAIQFLCIFDRPRLWHSVPVYIDRPSFCHSVIVYI